VLFCSQRAAVLLREANGKYTAKDLMGALKLYEDVLNQVRCRSQACWQDSSCRMRLAEISLQDAQCSAAVAGLAQQG
jgi:hypothetical protein